MIGKRRHRVDGAAAVGVVVVFIHLLRIVHVDSVGCGGRRKESGTVLMRRQQSWGKTGDGGDSRKRHWGVGIVHV